MAYQLLVIDKIKEKKRTFIELRSQTGISRTRITTMQRKNDAKLSELHLISKFLGCDINDLFKVVDEEDGRFYPRPSKRLIKKEREDEIHSLVKEHFPEDVERITSIMKLTEREITQRLWYNRFTPRAEQRIARLSGDENYLQSILYKISELKDSIL